MNYIITIVNPSSLDLLTAICDELELPISVVLMGKGTAVKSTLELLGIESNKKRILVTMANNEKTAQFINLAKKRLFIGFPDRGVVIAVPIKSIGGGKTVAYLNGNQQTAKYVPELDCTYELIVAISNEGRTDMVMDAAREAGARGGTALHGKGTGSKAVSKFYNVSISQEKEVILIVASTKQKAEIMHSILAKAGPGTEAGTICFSLPVSEVAGFGLFEDNE